VSYTQQIASAQRLLAAKGATYTLRHYPPTGPTSQDRIRGVVSATGAVDFSVTCVLVPIPMPRTAIAKSDAGLVLGTRRTVYVSGASCPVFPHKDDQLLGPEGRNWTIESVSSLAPDGGAPILHTLRVTS